MPTPLMETLRKQTKEETISYEHTYYLDGGELAIAVGKNENQYRVSLITDIDGPLILHWGISKRSRQKWALPPAGIRPSETVVFQDRAAETTFVDEGDYRKVQLNLADKDAPTGIPFVIRQVGTDCWINDNGRNFYIPVAVSRQYKEAFQDVAVAGLADTIIEREMGPHSWTLMHRFNLCYDLLENLGGNVEGLALIYVWLRFSALRQLDWQRNYNTQPRELSHAQDRLTLKLAEQHERQPQGRKFIRLILTTLGRGGEGQRVRDEVLNIMHRHHIKEISGHFMEEWHQKLHNNTTPDDVVICEAYLAFLKANGNLDIFYKTLEGGGVTRKRLKGFERSIVSDPDFIVHLKEALIHDFEHFLGILKSVHSGTDLGTAIHAARHLFDTKLHDLMDFVWAHRDDPETRAGILVAKIIEARQHLKIQLEHAGTNGRDALFVDLALDDFLRVVIERNLCHDISGDESAELITMVTEDLLVTEENDELAYSLGHWKRLGQRPRFEQQWSLEAKAVLDRVARALGAIIDRYYQILQPMAEFLGAAFEAEPWIITLFSEEVVRGSPAFALAALLRQIDPVLRKSAELGNWQVISPGQATGMVDVVSNMQSIQGKDFSQNTVIIADIITGAEEIPANISAIITPDTTDIVSHVAIRARNARVLFATCYDSDTITQLKSLRGHRLRLSVNATGDVVFEEGREAEKKDAKPLSEQSAVPRRLFRPGFTVYAVTAGKFNEGNVGGKSHNLKQLQGKVPNWIHLPASVALPFGVFEKVLSREENREVSKQYEALIQDIDKEKENSRDEILGKLRKTVMSLSAPEELVSCLREAMYEARLPWPENWEGAWRGIKGVWASKWNDRAVLSRKIRGIPHEDLFMAVLIQEVVKAEYSFVIHTVNPFTGDEKEVYAEVVSGLGETLVGNYPGRALGFTCNKDGLKPKIKAFPSKSIGLFGRGLIFRSDSNGEDLADYAGAGLYDSIMQEPPIKTRLDYTKEVLIQDEDFRNEFMVSVATIGAIIEGALGFPQDIEGAYCKGQYHVVQTRPQVGTANE